MILVAATNAALGVPSPTERRLTTSPRRGRVVPVHGLFLFAAPWGLQAGAHVRVDVLYSRLGVEGEPDRSRGRGPSRPFAVYAVVVTVPVAAKSLRIHEVSNDAGGLSRYPLLMAVPVAFGLLALSASRTSCGGPHDPRGCPRDRAGRGRVMELGPLCSASSWR